MVVPALRPLLHAEREIAITTITNANMCDFIPVSHPAIRFRLRIEHAILNAFRPARVAPAIDFENLNQPLTMEYLDLIRLNPIKAPSRPRFPVIFPADACLLPTISGIGP